MAERFRTLERDTFDVIVVGAGLGGLSAAAILARRGAQVLVLDRHYVAGGNATTFKRRGYEFDVGRHHIGACGPWDSVPRILRAAGADPVEFEVLDPDGFDTLVIPDLTFRVPKGVSAFRRRLLEHFLDEERGIDRYFSLLVPLAGLQSTESGARVGLRMLPKTLSVLPSASSTYASFLKSCTQNERLQAVLAGQSADYALPPSRASAITATSVVAHDMGGAYFPKGGGQVVPDRLAEAIERSGGKILLRAGVRRILVERGRAVGVEIESKHLGVRRVHAPVVISNADLKQTMEQLVGAPHWKPKTLARARAFEVAPAFGVVYLGLRRDLRAEKHPATRWRLRSPIVASRRRRTGRPMELPRRPSNRCGGAPHPGRRSRGCMPALCVHAQAAAP